MKPATHHCDLPRPVIRPTSLQTTKFKDGMVITADDLDTAMRYPLAVFQTLIRAYFGCGVLCGLKLHLKKPLPGSKDSKDCKDGKKPPVVICIDRGTALGGDGFPIELCAPVSIPLTPDPCCDDPPDCVCIAIRRITSDEAPRDDCGCSKDTDAPRYQCTRVKEHVEIKVFDCKEPLKGLCARPDPKDPKAEGCDEESAEQADAEREVVRDPCEIDRNCLTTCSDCDCCGPSWILLGCIINLTKDPKVDLDRRKYVKPIECLCPPPKPKKDDKSEEPAPQEPERYERKRSKR